MHDIVIINLGQKQGTKRCGGGGASENVLRYDMATALVGSVSGC